MLARAPTALVDPERRLDKSQNQERLRQSIRQVLASYPLPSESCLIVTSAASTRWPRSPAKKTFIARRSRQLHALLEHLRRLLEPSAAPRAASQRHRLLQPFACAHESALKLLF